MKRYSIVFLIYLILAVITFYGSYQAAYHYSVAKNKENIKVAEPVSSVKEPIVRADTEYIVEQYNQKDKSKREIKSAVPIELLGMNREDVLSYAKNYVKEPSLEDLEAGFLHMELISFSDEKVVFRKTYLPPEKSYKYSLGTLNGYIVVYYLDNQTVYEYTDIYLEDLPEEMKVAIRKEECRLDVHGLYDFLENYSS